MQEENLNTTQTIPEIPETSNPPQQVGLPANIPSYTPPVVLTSKKAREKTMKNLQELSRMTGKVFTL